MVQLGFSEDVVWLMIIGQLLDFIACHRQFHGMEKPKVEASINEVIPF
jgi:hypothetical protein